MRLVANKDSQADINNYQKKSFDNNRLVLNTKLGIVVVKSNQILRCEADRTYCNFHLSDGTLIRSSKSLKFYEEKLREWNFIKVHKSNMVNLTHVEGYVKGKGGSLILSDNTMVPVAIRKKTKVLNVFAD